MDKTLIAYFSRADENYFAGAMRCVKRMNVPKASVFLTCSLRSTPMKRSITGTQVITTTM